MKLNSQHRIRITIDVGGTRPPVIVLNKRAYGVLEAARSRVANDEFPTVESFAWTLCQQAVNDCRHVMLCCGKPH